MNTAKGKLLVLAGPSGVGKGTVSRFIVGNYPNFFLSVSATTRSPRPGEVDGVDYHFLSRSEFEELVRNGGFLEWATVHGHNFYGTLKEPVEEAIAAGQTVILEIDVQGARQVKENYPSALSVFLEPPDYESLLARLSARGTESPEELEIRLKTAEFELAASKEFDLVLINRDVSECAREVVEWIQSK